MRLETLLSRETRLDVNKPAAGVSTLVRQLLIGQIQRRLFDLLLVILKSCTSLDHNRMQPSITLTLAVISS